MEDMAYHAYLTFFTPYEQSWVDFGLELLLNLKMDLQPNRPSTYFNGYGPNYVPELVPAPPEPYETFDEKTAY